MHAATQVAALRTAIVAAATAAVVAVVAIAAAVVAAATTAEAAVTAVVDAGNSGLERTIEVPLMIEKARLLRQAGFLFVRPDGSRQEPRGDQVLSPPEGRTRLPCSRSHSFCSSATGIVALVFSEFIDVHRPGWLVQ